MRRKKKRRTLTASDVKARPVTWSCRRKTRHTVVATIHERSAVGMPYSIQHVVAKFDSSQRFLAVHKLSTGEEILGSYTYEWQAAHRCKVAMGVNGTSRKKQRRKRAAG